MRRWWIVALLGLAIAARTTGAQDDIEKGKIAFLIASVENLKGATFVRNGSDYSAGAAAGHLRTKLGMAGGRVKTADDFIRLCGSRSYITGEPYMIRFADGKTMPAEDFFREKLKEYGPPEKGAGPAKGGAGDEGDVAQPVRQGRPSADFLAHPRSQATAWSGLVPRRAPGSGTPMDMGTRSTGLSPYGRLVDPEGCFAEPCLTCSGQVPTFVEGPPVLWRLSLSIFHGTNGWVLGLNSYFEKQIWGGQVSGVSPGSSPVGATVGTRGEAQHSRSRHHAEFEVKEMEILVTRDVVKSEEREVAT